MFEAGQGQVGHVDRRDKRVPAVGIAHNGDPRTRLQLGADDQTDPDLHKQRRTQNGVAQATLLEQYLGRCFGPRQRHW